MPILPDAINRAVISGDQIRGGHPQGIQAQGREGFGVPLRFPGYPGLPHIGARIGRDGPGETGDLRIHQERLGNQMSRQMAFQGQPQGLQGIFDPELVIDAEARVPL